MARGIGRAYKEGGITALKAFLRGLSERATPVYEAKLLVTGQGRVGKTELIRALRGDPPPPDGERDTTYGVQRGTLSLPHPDSKESAAAAIRLNTWDFGGQEVYRVTHQFYFSEDAIYLLVYNVDTGAEGSAGDIEYWLKKIALRTDGRAKVIVVASHCPEGSPKYTPRFYKERFRGDRKLYDMIVDEVAVDSILGDGITTLRQSIAKHAAELPAMGDPFPTSWQRARDEALNSSERGTNYLRYDEFLKICTSNGLDDAQALTLAHVYIHRLGRAIYFGGYDDAGVDISLHNVEGHEGSTDIQSTKDPLLADIMVLDAEWLSRAIVQVLEDEPTKRAAGVLTHDRLNWIWKDHGRDDWAVYDLFEHEYLLRLLMKFDVSCPIFAEEGKRSLIVELVPDTTPKLPWYEPEKRPGWQTLTLVCVLRDEPQGLIPWLTAHTYGYHVYHGKGKNRTGLFWKSGIFLEERTYGNQALIKLQKSPSHSLVVHVSGTQPGWFMIQLHRTISDLLRRWPGLEYTFHVPCPTESEVRCDGNFNFDYLVAKHKLDRENPGKP